MKSEVGLLIADAARKLELASKGCDGLKELEKEQNTAEGQVNKSSMPPVKVMIPIPA